MFEKLLTILKPNKKQTDSKTSYISEEEEEDVSLESLVPQLSEDDYIPKSESFEMGYLNSNMNLSISEETDEEIEDDENCSNNYYEEEIECTENDILGDAWIYDGYWHYYNLLDND